MLGGQEQVIPEAELDSAVQLSAPQVKFLGIVYRTIATHLTRKASYTKATETIGLRVTIH